jgi:NADH-quinone oxidoreductase subunit N
MGVACATAKGFEAVYFYFIAYLIMNLGAFLVVQICGCQIHRVSSTVVARFIGQTDWPDKSGNYDMESISSYIGLARRGPYGVTIAIAMTIFLLSLTGVPPFFGFIGKFYLFSAVIDAKLYWLAIIGIMNSVVSLYYYMRIVKAMFFDDSPEAATQAFLAPPRTLFVILIILALATIFFGLYWQAIGQFISFIKI